MRGWLRHSNGQAIRRGYAGEVVAVWRLRIVALLVPAFIVTGGTTALAAQGPPPCLTGCATAIVPPGAAPQPFGISSGPLGSEWFADGPDNTVDRVDQQGAITTYPVPTPNSNPGWVTVDPSSGDVWFAERFGGKIGRITPDGTITEFPLPSLSSIPQGIVLGPDGNLYVTESGTDAIARLNPATGQVTEFPVPTPAALPLGLALGPDGALWFVERSASKVGRMTLDGSFTEYPLAPGAFPNRIVAAPDGALWFTELLANKIGRITTAGVLTEFPISGGPVGITVGKDGQLYTALFTTPGLDRVNLSGQVTGHWDLPGAVGTLQVATGFGLDIWVTDTFGGKVYRVTPYAVGQ
jgi:virginiamycin B lyase